MSLILILILFFTMDPFGNISSYMHMVRGLNPKRQSYIVMREMLMALFFMLLFNFIGEYILYGLGLSVVTVKISSGVILFLVAVKILFSSQSSLRANLPQEEPFLIPLAVPLIAGPALLATIMLYALTEPSQFTMLSSIFIAWCLSVAVLLAAPRLERILGVNGLTAFERLMGMILVLLSLQRILEGVK
ncbi:MAG: antibiotic transporter, partial [Parachlamydiaceae bacterium]|nr:antibiotic transporter [Parachlamydiaceae bacterium]